MGWVDEAGNVNDHFKSTTQGASTTLWCATSPQLDGMGGVYCEDCDIAAPFDAAHPMARAKFVMDHAVDPEAATRLWALSSELTEVDAFA